jgi:hypothetical protein
MSSETLCRALHGIIEAGGSLFLRISIPTCMYKTIHAVRQYLAFKVRNINYTFLLSFFLLFLAFLLPDASFFLFFHFSFLFVLIFSPLPSTLYFFSPFLFILLSPVV